jgi:membrane-bound ClpP family serine protease
MKSRAPGNANEFIEQQLDMRLLKIAEQFCSDGPCDIMSFTGPLFNGVDNLVRSAIERLKDESTCSRLIVVLTTPGGYIEPVRRIVDTMRTHYPTVVDFVIPDYAYSAGTILAMSGNSIHMDYYSRLGPIDPQEEVKGSRKLVPALGVSGAVQSSYYKSPK